MLVRLEYRQHYGPVFVDGEELSPERSRELLDHSSEFSWGYGGSGPAQLALALLLAAGVEDGMAVRLHQAFKEEFVSGWLHDGPGTVEEFDLDPLGWARQRS